MIFAMILRFIFTVVKNKVYSQYILFYRSMMGSMIGGSSRISLDSITDEITEPSHTHDFSTGLTGKSQIRLDAIFLLSYILSLFTFKWFG